MDQFDLRRTFFFALKTCGLLFVIATGLIRTAFAEFPTTDPQSDELTTQPPRSQNIAWAGTGAYRVLLRVDPLDIGNRKSDEMPGDVELDWGSLLKHVGSSGKADLRTVQVMQYDPATGQPILYSDYSYQRSPYDCAFCWYDASIPYEFPEVLAPSSRTNGKRTRSNKSRAGYMYNAIGDWKSGRLAWSHTQTGHAPSYYAVYFDRMEANFEPREASPMGWIGDAMPRHARWGESTTGADTTQATIDDWNDDGLFDIIYGEQYGQLFYMLNQGTKESPKFGPSRMIFEADGKPMDVGVHASPLVVDWDGDGVKDLLIGTYQNRIAYFRNVGTNKTRKFEYQGFLRDATGNVLALPVTPVAAKSEGVFKEDYFPVLTAADWDGDGKTDLLCGGYITGRIYFYRNTGQKDGLPALELVGPIEADGKPINVGDWCAAPCAVDLNGDGLLDLVVGSFTWSGSSVERPSFLRYYVNVGTKTNPVLKEEPLPVKGVAKPLRLPRPSAIDCNGDGLPDLVVSSGADIFIWPNIGTRTEPKFDTDQNPIQSAWGSAPIKVDHQVIDWNHDGLPDLVTRYNVYLNDGVGKPYSWSKTVPVLPRGMNIDHPVKMGDGHFYPYLCDLDRDGKVDVLFGDWHGNVWFHRNLSDEHESKFDGEGYKLQTTDNKDIKVGPIDADTTSDFQALQGARTTLVAGDFNGDGLDDLIVGDTYGKVRYYQNSGPLSSPRFAPPKVIADLKTRLFVEKADWNQDGKLDVIVSSAAHKIYIILNEGSTDGDVKFGTCEPLKLDIKGPISMVADLNHDGDEDLIVNGTQGTSFVEHSFAVHGYATGRVIGVEAKNEAPHQSNP